MIASNLECTRSPRYAPSPEGWTRYKQSQRAPQRVFRRGLTVHTKLFPQWSMVYSG